MIRFEACTPAELKTGDRFYKAMDKKKTPLVMVEHDVKKTHFRTYKYFCCPTATIDNPHLTQQQKARNYTPINKDTAVVFLRHELPAPRE